MYLFSKIFTTKNCIYNNTNHYYQSATAILKSILFTENIDSLTVGTAKQAKHNNYYYSSGCIPNLLFIISTV